MLELGHTQVRDGDEVRGGSEASGSTLGLLQQAVHRLHVGVAAVIQHAAHHPIEALLQRSGQLLERIEPTVPGPAEPAQQIRFGLHGAVFLSCFGINRSQGHLQPPSPRTLERGALQPVHRVGLLDAPVLRVASHTPGQTLEQFALVVAQGFLDRLGLRAHLLAANTVHGLTGHGNHMKSVVADLGLGQRLCHPLGVGSTHVLADMFDLFGLAPVGLEVSSEVDYGLVITPLAGIEQAFELQVVYDRDVVLSLSQAGLVNADDLYLRHVVQRACRTHVMFNAPPELFVRAAQQRCGLAHRQLLAKRQRKGFKQRCKTTAFACPGNINLAGFAAGATGNAGHLSVQPGFKLEEVQVPPFTCKAVMHALRRSTTVRARQAVGVASQIEVDTSARSVKLDIFDAPGSLQAKCTGKQRFNPDAHISKVSKRVQTPPRGFVDNSGYRVPHKPHRALLLS